jgi:hypothetical protein
MSRGTGSASPVSIFDAHSQIAQLGNELLGIVAIAFAGHRKIRHFRVRGAADGFHDRFRQDRTGHRSCTLVETARELEYRRLRRLGIVVRVAIVASATDARFPAIARIEVTARFATVAASARAVACPAAQNVARPVRTLSAASAS